MDAKGNKAQSKSTFGNFGKSPKGGSSSLDSEELNLPGNLYEDQPWKVEKVECVEILEWIVSMTKVNIIVIFFDNLH